MERFLIAERDTDWLRALRCLSLRQRPFTTLVQARDDEGFLRECPWGEVAPREVVLLCGPSLSSEAVASRMSLLRHLARTGRPGQTSVWVVADSERAAVANEAFLEIVRGLLPEFDLEATSLQALADKTEDAA
jgi:hypothetical protein